MCAMEHWGVGREDKKGAGGREGGREGGIQGCLHTGASSPPNLNDNNNPERSRKDRIIKHELDSPLEVMIVT